jgi:hypothetical protein
MRLWFVFRCRNAFSCLIKALLQVGFFVYTLFHQTSNSQKVFFHTFVRMFKKSLVISFLFLAWFLQLGHSLFPHAHVKEHHHSGKHHHHHNDEHSNENGLSLFFSHFNHTSDNFTKGHSDDEVRFIDVNSLKAVTTEIAEINLEFFWSSSKQLAKTFREPFVFISPHLLSLQFRGPPTLFS